MPAALAGADLLMLEQAGAAQALYANRVFDVPREGRESADGIEYLIYQLRSRRVLGSFGDRLAGLLQRLAHPGRDVEVPGGEEPAVAQSRTWPAACAAAS